MKDITSTKNNNKTLDLERSYKYRIPAHSPKLLNKGRIFKIGTCRNICIKILQKEKKNYKTLFKH